MAVHIRPLLGSQSAGSPNRQLAEAAAKLAPDGVELHIQEGPAPVPFYNEDTDIKGQVPQEAETLRECALRADAFLLVVPEYNCTLPAVLKNAVDSLSRRTERAPCPTIPSP